MRKSSCFGPALNCTLASVKRALRKIGAGLSALMLVSLTASAKPLDEDTIVTLLGAGFSDADIAKKIGEEGYSGSREPETLKKLREAGAGVDLILAVKEALFSYSGLANLARIEAANLGITDRTKIEQFVRDYIEQNTVSADSSPQTEPDFYAENPNTPRCQIMQREGKYGLKVKGKVVVEPEWDDWDRKFDPDGSGTFTFSRFSKVGLSILDDIIAKKSGMYELASMEAAGLDITDEKERRAFMRRYLMNNQLDNKVKWFDKSVTHEVSASDDPLALIEYSNGSGLKRMDGTIFVPAAAGREDFDFSVMFYLPAESVGYAGEDSVVTPAFVSPDEELKELAGDYYINLLRTLGNMDKLSGNSEIDPKLRMDLIDDDAIPDLLGAKSRAFFEKWAQEERDTRFLFLVLVEQLDSTWKAELRAEIKESSAE